MYGEAISGLPLIEQVICSSLYSIKTVLKGRLTVLNAILETQFCIVKREIICNRPLLRLSLQFLTNDVTCKCNSVITLTSCLYCVTPECAFDTTMFVHVEKTLFQ